MSRPVTLDFVVYLRSASPAAQLLVSASAKHVRQVGAADVFQPQRKCQNKRRLINEKYLSRYHRVAMYMQRRCVLAFQKTGQQYLCGTRAKLIS